MSCSDLEKNIYGFYEIKNKPSIEELSDYYRKKYYQSGEGKYNVGGGYSKEEIDFFLNKVEQKYQSVLNKNSNLSNGNKLFLDIGAGEGWALRYFSSKGWDCLGMDFSDHGCLVNNPEQLSSLLVGDIYTNIQGLMTKGKKFDVILLDNVLEHVIDPYEMLENIRGVISDDGLLIVEVPNDFSITQKQLLDEEYVSREYWVAPPDHLSYFNKEGLEALAVDVGWSVETTFTAYPIDFNLFNESTNFVENSNVGKGCHHARVAIENMLHSISVEKTIKLYESMADLGIGREIIMILSSRH